MTLRRTSIVDVAARAGVSVATVSRALRGMPNVSGGTRDRVLRAARELEYAASPLASGLVTGRTRAVGVVLPYAQRWFFAEVIRGIEQALRDQGYDLVLHVLADSRRRRDFFDQLPVRRRVDAVLVVGLPLDQREVGVLRGLGLPLAAVAEPVPGVHGERIDDLAAARLAVRHLIDLGHRRIACIGGELDGAQRFEVPTLRTEGYRAALAEAGLAPQPGWERDGCFTARGGERAMAGLLGPCDQARGRLTAVFCQSDEMAFGALHALRCAGLRCPEDVSIVGIDDHELAEACDLTTVAQPVGALAAAAASWLVARLDGTAHPEDPDDDDSDPDDPDDPDDDVVLHPVRLVLRGSTGPPSAGSSLR